MDTKTLRYCDDALEIVSRGRVFGNRWFATPAHEAFEKLRTREHQLVEQLGDGRHVVLSVLEASVGLRVDEQTRRGAATLAGEMRSHTIALGQWVRGHGFFASASRAVLSGVMLAARPGYPARVFGEGSECLVWLTEQLEREFPGSGDDVREVFKLLLS